MSESGSLVIGGMFSAGGETAVDVGGEFVVRWWRGLAHPK